MTKEQLRFKYWTRKHEGKILNYEEWLEEEYLKLVNNTGLDKPIFPPFEPDGGV